MGRRKSFPFITGKILPLATGHGTVVVSGKNRVSNGHPNTLGRERGRTLRITQIKP